MDLRDYHQSSESRKIKIASEVNPALHKNSSSVINLYRWVKRQLCAENIHVQHEQLILQALGHLGSQVKFDQQFNSPQPETQSAGTDMHLDEAMLDSFRTPTISALQLCVRLHTATNFNSNGAHFLLVNSNPRASGVKGDIDIFNQDDPSIEMAKRGYDVETDYDIWQKLEDFGGVSHDPFICDSTIYTFSEHPFYSVLFRSAGTNGAMSAHDVQPIDPGLKRMYYSSDLIILSQSV